MPAVAATETDTGHRDLSARLAQPSTLRDLKARISGTWRIVGLETRDEYALANFVGRGLARSGVQCGLKLDWDASTHADKLVWPIILKEVSNDEVAGYIGTVWLNAGVEVPASVGRAASAIKGQIDKWGVGLLAVSVGTPLGDQEVNLVFFDEARMGGRNRNDALAYGIVSTIAGISVPEGTEPDPSYSVLYSTSSELSQLIPPDENAISKLCHVLPVVSASCGGSFDDVEADLIEEALRSFDASCVQGGAVMQRLEKIWNMILAEVGAGGQ